MTRHTPRTNPSTLHDQSQVSEDCLGYSRPREKICLERPYKEFPGTLPEESTKLHRETLNMPAIASDPTQRLLGIVHGGIGSGQGLPYYDYKSHRPHLQLTTSSESMNMSAKQLLKSNFKTVDQNISIDLKNLEKLPQKPEQLRPSHQKALFGSLSFLSRLDWRGKGSRNVKSEPIDPDVRRVAAKVSTYVSAQEVQTLSPVLSGTCGSRLVTMGGEKQRLPGIIVRTVEEIYQRGVNTPNLFCTPEDLNRVQDLVKNFATPPNYGLHYDLAHENIHTICASLIWFLRALPAPLLDEARFDLLSLCCSNLNSNLEVVPPLEKAPDTGMIGIAQRILRHIPAERFNLFIYLFSFMSQTERSPEYDLTSRILGDCFGPALFLPRQSSNGDDALNNINTSGTSSLEASNLVVWMLTHWDLIVNELLPEKFEIKKFRPSPAIPTIKDSWATWQGFRVNQDQEGPSLILPIKQIRRKSSAFEYHFGTSKNFPPLPPHYTRVDDDATPEPLNGVESKPFSHKSFETSTETASHPSGPQHKFRRRSSAFDYHSINRTAVKKSPLGAGGKRTNGKSSPLKDTKEIEEAEAPHDPSQIPHAFPRQLRTADHDLTDLSSIPTPTATAVSDLSDLLVSVDEVGRDEKYEKALKSFKFGDLPPESPTNTSSRRQRQSPHPIVLTKSTSNGIKSAVHKSQDVSFEHNRNFSFGSNNFLEGDRVFVQESLSVPGTASNAFQASISPLKTKAPVSPKLTAQLAHHDTSSVPFHKTQSPITPATIQNHHAPRISRRRSSCHESTSLDRPIHRRINHSVSVSKYYDGRAHTSKPIVKTIREIVAERKKGLVSHTHDFEVHTVGAGSTYKQNSDEKSVRDSQLMPSPVVYATWELVPVDLNLARTPVQNSTNVKLTQEGLP